MDTEKIIQQAKENCVGYFYIGNDELRSFGTEADSKLIDWSTIYCVAPLSRFEAWRSGVPWLHVRCGMKAVDPNKMRSMEEVMKDRMVFIHVPLNKKRFVKQQVEIEETKRFLQTKGKQPYTRKELDQLEKQYTAQLEARYSKRI